MGREIKFRAITDRNATIIFDLLDLIQNKFSNREILWRWLREANYPDQFTGLRDKNGKEIYEGDVVKLALPFWKSREFDYMGRVDFCDGRFLCVDVIDVKHKQPYRSCYMRFSRIEMDELYECLEMEYVSNHGEVCKRRSENLVYCEVIGNIHENPEHLNPAPHVGERE